MSKQAETRYPIHELLASRWSPRAFADRTVAPETLGALFEAARWAASCFNEQPWRFIVATREQPNEFERLLGCLVEPNQAWAKAAPVLVLGVVKKTFAHNGKPNAHARHDLGLATGGLTVQASALELYVHAMAGILPEEARSRYQIPEDYDVVTAFAIGYLGDPDSLPGAASQQERAPRERRTLATQVFADTWDAPANFAG